MKYIDHLHYLGVNFWKIPIVENTTLLEKFNNLIKAEIITENIMGTPLKRD